MTLKDDPLFTTPTEPNLYNACCLQLARYVADEATVHRCANDRCGKPFTRQRSESKYRQHRSTGVRYCSPRCAANQAERGRRARRRQEKGQEA